MGWIPAPGVRVRKNSGGAFTSARQSLNLIEGANVTLTVADDAADNEVDVTITASGGGAAIGAHTYHRPTVTLQAG